MNKPENNKIAQLFENLKQTEEKYNQLSKAEKAIKDIDFAAVQSISDIEKEIFYSTSKIKQIETEIKAIQATCTHPEYTWVGNAHNCDYYQCTECGYEIKI